MSQTQQVDLEFALADAGHSLTIDFAAIKEQFPIMGVASALTGQDVKKVGSNTYRLDDASCPLCGHNDCFTLYPDDDSFHCFSCEENGDVFDLIVKCDKARSPADAARLLLLGELSVTPTVRKVVKLEPPIYTVPPARLQELFKLAANHYQARLDVEELMKLRGHSEDVLVGLDIGISGGLNKALKDAGFSQEERLASGLVKLRNDAPICFVTFSRAVSMCSRTSTATAKSAASLSRTQTSSISSSCRASTGLTGCSSTGKRA